MSDLFQFEMGMLQTLISALNEMRDIPYTYRHEVRAHLDNIQYELMQGNTVTVTSTVPDNHDRRIELGICTCVIER